jgi:hypothetical protein
MNTMLEHWASRRPAPNVIILATGKCGDLIMTPQRNFRSRVSIKV